MDTKKYKRVLIYVLVVVIIIFSFIILNNEIDHIINLVDDSNAYAYQFESLDINDDEVVIKGWFVELKSVRNVSNEADKEKEIAIWLCDIEDFEVNSMDESKKYKDGYNMSLQFNERSDVNEYLKCEYDYSYCGFIAKMPKSKFDANKKYQLVVLPDSSKRKAILCNAFISDGKLVYVNPEEFVSIELKVTGTDIEEVVKDGNCLGVFAEKGVYIYQYDHKLFYIVNGNSNIYHLENAYLEYMIETTQYDKLPQERLDNGWFFDNRGFFFKDYDVTDTMNCGEYKVAVIDIPEYAVTQIVTGYREENQWIWSTSIRPVVSYLK